MSTSAEPANAPKESEPRRNEGVSPVPTQEPATGQDGGLLRRVFSGAPGEPPGEGTARFLGSPRLSHPANNGLRAIALKKAQQAHGNRFVQRVAAHMQQKPLPAIRKPLDSHSRDTIASRVGSDVKDVRIQSDEAAASAQAQDANNSTIRRDMYFASGKYAPETSEGRRLLAHELVHTPQQAATGRSAASGLSVSTPDDPYEREADAVAEQVMRMPEPRIAPDTTWGSSQGPTCGRCKGKDEILPSADEESGGMVRANSESDAPVEGSLGGFGSAIPGDAGQPLPESSRLYLEPRFARSFENVRVHDDSESVDAARSLNALAFTHGDDIYFGAGQYQPGTAQGDKLLAHELTHTLQQREPGRVQRELLEEVPVGHPGVSDHELEENEAKNATSETKIRTKATPQSIQRQMIPDLYGGAVLIGKNSSYELKGNGKFEPNLFLQAYISDQPDGALVNVHFGGLAKGKLYVTKTGPDEYRAFPAALPMTHPDIASPGGGKSLSLIVSIGAGNEITGSVGVTHPLPPNSIGAPYGSPEDQEAFLSLLIGQTATHGKIENLKVQNELKDGALNFWYVFVNDLYPGTYLTGVAALINEAFLFKGILHTSGKGLAPSDTEIKRDKTGDLFGRMDMSTEWESKSFAGKLNATYEDGILEVRGTLKYHSPRVNGELNVLATEEDRAWQAVQTQLAAIQSGGAGGGAPAHGAPRSSGTPTAGSVAAPVGTTGGRSPLALTGWGVLKLVVTDKINADAAFVVDPDGYLTLRGTIRSPHQITLMDAKPTEEKTFFDKDYSEMEYVWWAVGVRAQAHVKLTASGVFGPLTLYDITITGVYSTRPEAGSELEISSKLNLSASAKARLEAGGELAARLGTKYSYLGVNAASVALNIATEAEVRGVVEAQPTIKRQTKGAGSGADAPKYTLGGELFIGGKIDLKLTGDLVFTAAGEEIHAIHLGDKVYPIAGFGLTSHVSYTIGSDETPKVSYKTGEFEPLRFIRHIVKEKRPKDTDDKVAGGFKEGGKEKGHVVESADIPPEPPHPAKTQVIDFSMAGRQHSLFITLAGPHDPVQLEMSSKRGPLRPKIYKAEMDLIGAKYDPETDEPAKKKIDRRLEDLTQAFNDAARLEQAASKLGAEPEATQMDVPGLRDLGDELQNYGERYHVTDLAEPTVGQAQPTSSPQPGAGTGTDLEAEEVMSSWPGLKKDQHVIDQVRLILNTGSLPKDQFRTIMDKAKVNGAAGKRFLGYLEQLAVRKFSGITVVFSDLEIGGNKFAGAAFMLRYIDENDLWGAVTEFEAARDDRRIDAIIRRTQFEFKSWGEFRAGTFMDQVGKDYQRTGLKGVRWVLQKRELGDKDAIIQLMKDALNDKELRKKYGITRAESMAIMDELDRIVIVY